MSWDVPKDPFTVGEVLKVINTAMNILYSDKEWPCWDTDAANIAKTVFNEVYASMMGEYSVDDSTTYLDTTPPTQYCFLGIWDNVDKDYRRYYTLLMQPSLGLKPIFHCTLHHEMLNWDITANRICFENIPWFDAPAILPRPRSISLRIDFLPGERWRIELFRPGRAQFFAVGEVLFMIHQRFVIDELKMTFSKLPPYLMYEI